MRGAQPALRDAMVDERRPHLDPYKRAAVLAWFCERPEVRALDLEKNDASPEATIPPLQTGYLLVNLDFFRFSLISLEIEFFYQK